VIETGSVLLVRLGSPMAIGDTSTLRLDCQLPVSTTRYRTTQVSPPKRKSDTFPMCPSAAPMA
jgi:hypothetical protein